MVECRDESQRDLNEELVLQRSDPYATQFLLAFLPQNSVAVANRLTLEKDARTCVFVQGSILETPEGSQVWQESSMFSFFSYFTNTNAIIFECYKHMKENSSSKHNFWMKYEQLS